MSSQGRLRLKLFSANWRRKSAGSFSTAAALVQRCQRHPHRPVFRGELTVPLDQLKLREGQDLKLASLEELRSERI